MANQEKKNLGLPVTISTINKREGLAGELEFNWGALAESGRRDVAVRGRLVANSIRGIFLKTQGQKGICLRKSSTYSLTERKSRVAFKGAPLARVSTGTERGRRYPFSERVRGKGFFGCR